MGSPRVLFLLNPGKLSRHYVLGLVAAAGRLGVEHATLELEPLWTRVRASADVQTAFREIHAAVAATVRRLGITHALGYAHTGSNDLGLLRGPAPTLLASLGVRHLMLWTDHPEWLVGGCALDEPLRSALDHPLHTHVLKSACAADEASAVLGWGGVHASAVGEDFAAMLPRGGVEVVHDAVAIIGGCEPVPPVLLPFLDVADPSAAEMDLARRPEAERAFDVLVAREDCLVAHAPALRELARAWLDLKVAGPSDSLWRLSRRLGPEHRPALELLRAVPRRWYGAVSALRTMTAWRRSFTLAWLSRRVALGVYGADASPLMIAQEPGAARWVSYGEQSLVYARGACAVTINAAWDEEGLSHKAFQIAASGVACVHGPARGIEACFEPGVEVCVPKTLREWGEAVERLRDDSAWRERMGRSARLRGERDHDWSARLRTYLSMGDDAEVVPSEGSHEKSGKTPY